MCMVPSAARRRTFATLLAVCSGATTAQAQARWTLTEAWRIGGADTGATAFVYVKGIAADASGRVFVYDRSTQEIRLFGSDGKLVRVIGRKGSGPGEFRDAEGIAIAADGRLWVRDAANARFSVFRADGAFERNWTMKFCTSQGAWTPRMDERERFIDEDCVVAGGRAVGYVLLAYRTDRLRVDTLAPKPECGSRELAEAATWITRTERRTTYRTIPYAPSAFAAVGKGATLWCVPNSARFEMLRLSPTSSDTLRITRRVPVVPVTRAERDSIITQLEVAGPSGLDFSRIPSVKPAIDRLTVDDQGRVWVRSTNPAGAIEFTVYSPEGALVATAVWGRYNSPTWHPFVVRGGSLYAVVQDDDDVQHVAHFRIRQ